jgi:serine/threonine protein kinase
MSIKHSEFALKAGTILKNGIYTLRSVIGAGGFGVTYLASKRAETSFGQDSYVVIKELFLTPNARGYYCHRTSDGVTVRPSDSLLNSYPDFIRRFKEEAETLYRFRHLDGMVQVLDLFEENNTYYFTMEYIDSSDLYQYVAKKGPLSVEEASRIITKIGDLLTEIHKEKVLHRDIKPHNILIDNNGKPYLIDFGIAKSYGDFDKVSKITGFATEGYASPEQLSGGNNLISPSMDVYSLAATLYFCLTNFDPPKLSDRNLGASVSVREHNKKISLAIEKSIEKAMTIRPQERTSTVDEFLKGLPKISVDEDKSASITNDKNKGKVAPQPPKSAEKQDQIKNKIQLPPINTGKISFKTFTFKKLGEYIFELKWEVKGCEEILLVVGTDKSVVKSIGHKKVTIEKPTVAYLMAKDKDGSDIQSHKIKLWAGENLNKKLASKDLINNDANNKSVTSVNPGIENPSSTNSTENHESATSNWFVFGLQAIYVASPLIMILIINKITDGNIGIEDFSEDFLNPLVPLILIAGGKIFKSETAYGLGILWFLYLHGVLLYHVGKTLYNL